jgi:phosphoglycolate phosphatase-like HAD superfamily hydrolase
MALERDQLTGLLQRARVRFAIEATFVRAWLAPARATMAQRLLASEGFGAAGDAAGGELLIPLTVPLHAAAACLERALFPDLLCLDVDGTLIDNSVSLLATIRMVVELHTQQRPTVQAIIAVHRQRRDWTSDDELAQEICRAHGSTPTLEDIQRWSDFFYYGNDEQAGTSSLERPLFDAGLRETLAQYPLALVTSRTRRKLAPILSILALPETTKLVCRDDVAADKPDPEGVRRAMSLFPCARPWMIGDRPSDILAGCGAGAVAIGVGPDRATLEAAGAAVVLGSINELPTILPSGS